MAPLLAMLAVFLTDPAAVPAVFSGLFMDKVGSFLKLYFPVFLLGALFGKLIEISGFSRVIVTAVIGLVGAQRAIPMTREKPEIRSEEHTSELKSLMRISYAVFCWKKKKTKTPTRKYK